MLFILPPGLVISSRIYIYPRNLVSSHRTIMIYRITFIPRHIIMHTIRMCYVRSFDELRCPTVSVF